MGWGEDVTGVPHHAQTNAHTRIHPPQVFSSSPAEAPPLPLPRPLSLSLPPQTISPSSASPPPPPPPPHTPAPQAVDLLPQPSSPPFLPSPLPHCTHQLPKLCGSY